jgi:hypothetical protein
MQNDEPKKSGKEKKEAYLHMRITCDQKTRWKDASKKDGVIFTTWITKIIENRLKNASFTEKFNDQLKKTEIK